MCTCLLLLLKKTTINEIANVVHESFASFKIASDEFFNNKYRRDEPTGRTPKKPPVHVSESIVSVPLRDELMHKYELLNSPMPTDACCNVRESLLLENEANKLLSPATLKCTLSSNQFIERAESKTTSGTSETDAGDVVCNKKSALKKVVKKDFKL